MTDIVEDRIISEEYKIWKKNTPFMYDFMMTRAVEWPSPTVQWFPEVEALDDEKSTRQQILLGTHTLNEQNYLIVASVNLPDYTEHQQNDLYHIKEDEFGAFSMFNDKFDMEFKVFHEGIVKCARYMPQNSNIVATKSDLDLFIYDLQECRENPDSEAADDCKPIFEYIGVDTQSNLEWNSKMEGSLLTCFEKNQCALWDVNLEKSENNQMVPKLKFSSQSEGTLNSIGWHCLHPTIFGSVSSEGEFFLWDIRSSDTSRASHRVKGHKYNANQIQFNPFSEFVFATSSVDRTIALWDLRNLKVKLHSINSRNEDFVRINWSPHGENIIGASTTDRRIHLFDLERIHEEQTLDDADDGPSTLVFIHNGHTSRVYDFSWNINDPLMICSVSDDNIVQIWQIISKYFEPK